MYSSGGLSFYRHPDWLGSSRFASTPARAMYYDGAYAPFGEVYSELGTIDRSYTGQNQDTVAGLYDFLYRENSANQGRWISPDPAGLDAANTAYPQSLNRYAYVGNNPCNATDPFGLDTCTFNIQVNNNAGLSETPLAALEGRINTVFGSAQWNGNSVQAQFSFTGKPDFKLNISPNTSHVDGYSGWPFGSPTIYWGNIGTYTNAAIYGGTAAAHEIVHRGAGPVLDLWGSYNGVPNLMNVNQAQSAGLGAQVAADWSNPAAAAGFASLSSAQVQKLFSKCSKAHPTNPVSPGRSGGGGIGPVFEGGGSYMGDPFYFLELLNSGLLFGGGGTPVVTHIIRY